MDDADLAQRHDEVWTDAAIRRARAAVARTDGTPDCEACGDPIPAARRAALPGARRCVPCAEGGRAPR